MLGPTALMMGVSLAAASGLRGGVPLLLTVSFARMGQIPWHPHFGFLTTNAAIGVLWLGTLIEISGDFLPGCSHTLDVVHLLVRPAVATLLIAGLLVEIPPMVGIAIGMIIGASISGFVHAIRAAGRAVISAATWGIAHLFLSLLENFVAGLLTLFALIAPQMVFILTVAFLILLMVIARSLFKRIRQAVMRVIQNLAVFVSPSKKRGAP